MLTASVSQLFISKALSIASWIACKPSAKSNVDHGLQANRLVKNKPKPSITLCAFTLAKGVTLGYRMEISVTHQAPRGGFPLLGNAT
jgi:hypothetical protein